jgi:hypothetical protein
MVSRAHPCLASLAGLAGLAAALISFGAAAQPAAVCPAHSPPPPQAPAATPTNSSVAYQQFPPTGPLETAWFVTFDHGAHRAFYITSAYFKPGPAKPWVKILANAGLAELFVPYQTGSPRFLDLSTFDFELVQGTPADAGACGQVVGRERKVIREVVDKGPLWKNDEQVYRGHKMILWATLDAANYNYLISYAFHDDGRIEFRIAGTAVNLPSRPLEAHVHNAIWRIDVDLNGPNGNSVFVNRHIEPANSASWNDLHEPFNGGKEGAMNFSAPEFTTLHVMDATLKNSRGSPSGYMLQPVVMGVPRHQETFMRNDFWVTRFRASELSFTDIQTYAGNNESIQNTDVVIWHVTPVLHLATRTARS